MPDPHRVVTKNDPLPTNTNLRHLIPTAEGARELTNRRVVISFDHVYVAADDAVTVQPRLIRAAETEVSEEIENIVLADLAVEIGEKSSVHIFDCVEWPIAIANDIAVAEMKIRSEPDIDHKKIPQK